MEVLSTWVLLEVNAYTVMEVLDNAVVQAHVSSLKHRYCYCDPNVGLMGYEDLIVALGHNISNAVVVVVNTRATEVFQNKYFVL